jgi:hypothetical protein
MSRKFIVLIPVWFLWAGFDSPCSRKIITKNGPVITIYYPSCQDSSTCFVRTFEKGSLTNEVWVKGNRPAGIENYYSGDKQNLITSAFFWGVDKEEFSMGYFAGTNRLNRFEQKLNDSVYYHMEFYFNGHVKAHGLTDLNHCYFGTWIESDSLGLNQWTGKYKKVNKKERIPGENIVSVTMWCFEKDSIWTRTDSRNKTLEEKVYVEGKEKTAKK